MPAKYKIQRALKREGVSEYPGIAWKNHRGSYDIPHETAQQQIEQLRRERPQYVFRVVEYNRN